MQSTDLRPASSFAASSGIYRIVNRINGKFYIGSAANLKGRKKNHFEKLNANVHPSKHLQASWNKYGRDAFDLKRKSI